MESLEETLKTKAAEKPKSKSTERIRLGIDESQKVEQWLAQVNESSGGFLTLTKSDLINFLVNTHKDEFSTRELNQIRASNYDPLKHLSWIAPQIKDAFLRGDTARVTSLQSELRKVELLANKNIEAKLKAFDLNSNGNEKSRIERKSRRKIKEKSALKSDNSSSEIDFSEEKSYV